MIVVKRESEIMARRKKPTEISIISLSSTVQNSSKRQRLTVAETSQDHLPPRCLPDDLGHPLNPLRQQLPPVRLGPKDSVPSSAQGDDLSDRTAREIRVAVMYRGERMKPESIGKRWMKVGGQRRFQSMGSVGRGGN